MKKMTRARQKDTAGKSSHQGKNPAPGATPDNEFDQSKWGRGLEKALQQVEEFADMFTSNTWTEKTADLARQFGERVSKTRLGKAFIRTTHKGPQIVLQGRWIQAAGFSPGELVTVSVPHAGEILIRSNIQDKLRVLRSKQAGESR